MTQVRSPTTRASAGICGLIVYLFDADPLYSELGNILETANVLRFVLLARIYYHGNGHDAQARSTPEHSGMFKLGLFIM